MTERKSREEALRSALKSLGRKDYSRRALARKLLEKGFSPETIHGALDACEKVGVLDERRFAERYAASAMSLRGFAPARVRRELMKKGIPEGIADDVARGLGAESEDAAIGRAIERRQHSLPPPETPEARRKWEAYLRRLGFRPSLIRDALDSLRRHEEAASRP